MAYSYWMHQTTFEAAQVRGRFEGGIDRVPFQKREEVEEIWIEREDWRSVAGFVKTKRRFKSEPHARNCVCPICSGRVKR